MLITRRITPQSTVKRIRELVEMGVVKQWSLSPRSFFTQGMYVNDEGQRTCCVLGLTFLRDADIAAGSLQSSPGDDCSYGREIERRAVAAGYQIPYIIGFDNGFAKDHTAWTNSNYEQGTKEHRLYIMGRDDGEACRAALYESGLPHDIIELYEATL